MFNKEMGTRIRTQRELLGYTREALAEKLDISTKFCSDIENGTRGMSLDTLCKLSKELLLTTDYILFGTTNPELDDELSNLLHLCKTEKRVYLKNIIRNFIQANNE
ncbi:MAG: helix-turn-helix transcriptional regulator [Clostridia bacterium]|nr:helix-turn-helix transcriptional regulator [Clostridia bacterium]